jgi:hypothetical protein
MSPPKEKKLHKKLSRINIESTSILYYIRTANPSTFNVLIDSNGMMVWYSFVKNQHETGMYDLVGTYTYTELENGDIIPSYNEKKTCGLDIDLMALVLCPDSSVSKVYFSPKPIEWLIRERLPSNIPISPRWKTTVLKHFNKFFSFSSYTFALIYLYICAFDIELYLTDDDWKIFDYMTNNTTYIDYITRDICINLLIRIENKILTG